MSSNDQYNDKIENATSHIVEDDLGDEQRVKVLSPSMLVFKRFVRNKLAIVGICILIFMFLFSFVGGLFSPYREDEKFQKDIYMNKDYASATFNKQFAVTAIDGQTFPNNANAGLFLAISKGESNFTAGSSEYNLNKVNDELYIVASQIQLATADYLRGIFSIKTGADKISDAVAKKFENAVVNGQESFTDGDITYHAKKSGRSYVLTYPDTIGFASKMIYATSSNDINLSYDFKLQSIYAITAKSNSFVSQGISYTIDYTDYTAEIYEGENHYVSVSQLAIQPITEDIVISLEFRNEILDAVVNNKEEIKKTENGNEITYQIIRKNEQYTIKKETLTRVIDMYAAPSYQHWLGTDANGMDVLTRLMYGGRVSLMIGFIVVLIELFIGVILGGIAGYFGGWVDNLIMRLVDIFYCIPSLPLYIILGSIMDAMRVPAKIRIFYLMLVLGFLSWSGVARLVRGQILSLREQEFMIATEATGISVNRRIFKHLIPNVIPQLIVLATMDLGGIILTEATLSFLGLGVKFPYASWGNIINAVNDVFVMTNYWFVWIPAGMLILLTVLGFNFVGDGLRDAFDPKMKR